MQFRLLGFSGYFESIISVRMSTGKFYSWEKTEKIMDLVGRVVNHRGFLLTPEEYHKRQGVGSATMALELYEKDVAEFKRLLNITFEQSMYKQDHHTLMKYIGISFVTEGLHRGAQDDLDSHAIGFNNCITRYSTRLAPISEQKVSEWYEDKILPFGVADEMLQNGELVHTDGTVVEYHEYGLPEEIEYKGVVFKKTPFGYVAEKYATVPATNGRDRDVQRGLMGLATPGPALWKTDIFNLRYIYFRRSKLTKTHPELKIGIEQLADQIEHLLPVFGPYFRKEYTDSGVWEHTNRVRTIGMDEFKEFMEWKGKVVKEESEEHISNSN